MPDRATRIEADSESGKIKMVVPTQSAKDEPKDTRVEVDPGTREHTVTASDVPHEDQHERRRQQAPVHVQVQQPQTGGLIGPWASVANMSAVGAFILITFLMYRDFTTTVRERDQLIREEMRQSRSNEQSSNAAMVAALAGLTTKMDALAISNNTMAQSNSAIITEFRLSQQEMRSLVKTLAGKAKLDPEPDPQGAIPMPRTKGDGGG